MSGRAPAIRAEGRRFESGTQEGLRAGLSDREDMVIGLWEVLGLIEEVYSRQVLRHPDGVGRKRRSVEFEVGAWWEEVCGITKWDPGSRKWEGELVWF